MILKTYISTRVPLAYVPPTNPTHLLASNLGCISSTAGPPARPARVTTDGAATAKERTLARETMEASLNMVRKTKT